LLLLSNKVLRDPRELAMNSLIIPKFERLVAEYENTAEHNDRLFRALTELTSREPILCEHRHHIEFNKLGFGDAAFHAMWLRLLDNAHRRFGSIHALEIGVFKGQVISLWSLIAKHWSMNVQVSAITPLRGHPAPRSGVLTWLRGYIDTHLREQIRNGNFYDDCDYANEIKRLFEHFGLKLDAVQLYEGYSTDKQILETIDGAGFHIVYVDGDHTFEGALNDFKVYGNKVVQGGWVVADDAGCFLPGTTFWKGHEAVSRAADVLPRIGFRNVLNVGHNRIYERGS
jgi:hypothetical protein